jgi:hypothetical protein
VKKPNNNDGGGDSIWQRDLKVREDIASANPEIASLCEIGLRLLASGVVLMAGPPMQPNEMVMGMAASQTSNSLRSAVNLAFGGYPIQSLAVTRLAAEYWLLFTYMQIRPDEAPGWLDFSAEPPKKAGDLAKVVFGEDPTSSEVFRDLRQVLHKFAHQDNLGLAAVYKKPEGSTAVLQLSSDPDPHYLAAAAYMLLLVMVLSLDSISRSYGARDHAWAASVAKYVPVVIAWQDRVTAEEEQRLRAMGLISE